MNSSEKKRVKGVGRDFFIGKEVQRASKYCKMLILKFFYQISRELKCFNT